MLFYIKVNQIKINYALETSIPFLSLIYFHLIYFISSNTNILIGFSFQLLRIQNLISTFSVSRIFFMGKQKTGK